MIAEQALFFPFTDVSEARLARALLLFGKIILYRLPLSQPAPWVDRAVEMGLARLERADFFDNDAELTGVLDQLSRTMELYRDPGTLSLLRNLADDEDPEKSGSRLADAIRSGGRPAAKDARRTAEIFLHLIERIDRQQSEIDEVMSDTVAREKGLGDIMGVEPMDEEAVAAGLAPLMGSTAPDSAGTEMMPRRLTAWTRFYEALGPHDGPLFTDRPEATSALDLGLAKLHPGGAMTMPAPAEILEPLIGIPIGASWPARIGLDDVARLREETAVWSGFMAKVASRPWRREELAGLREEAAGLAARGSEGPYLLTAWLLPGGGLKEAMASATGTASGPVDSDVFRGPVFELKLLPI
jgi:hypothetical protein